MRLLLLILFVSSVLTDEKITKVDDKKVEDKKDIKKSVEETKSKTGKRDSSDQTAAFGVNLNDEPFKPMLNSPAPFEAAASATQQVYYDKNQVTPGEGAGNAKSNANPQAANAYRAQYSQVAHQQQQQQQQNKNHVRVAAKNVGIQQQQQQQQQQPNILYAVPQNPAYHYERNPQQQPQQQQQQIQLQAPAPLAAQQRGQQQQKQIQYVLAIPLSYLRQIQQQLIHQQQQEQPTHLQVYKGQQQPQHQQQQQQQPQQIQTIPVYSIGGPLARDNNGAYRPFHRFAPTAVNDVSTGAQHQTTSALPITQPIVPASPAPPGYVTQYIQIPASALLAAVQSAQVHQPQQQLQQQQQRPVHLPQNVYQQQQPQLQLQLQPPIHQQQNIQTQSPQLIYYQPQQQQQQQVQLKQSQPSHALTSPPVYAYHVNHLQQQQQQQPTQQHQTYQHLTEQQQQQQNVGKQPHRVRGVRPTANLTPSQYDSSAAAYEHEEKAQLVVLQAPTHPNLNAHSHTNAHSQQYIAQAPLAQQQQHQQQTAPTHQVVQAPEAFENVVHYNPQYVQHYQDQQQQQRQPQHQPHRLHIQPQHTPLVEHLNNLQFSQGIHGPTPLPFLRLHPAAGVTPFFPPAISQPFVSSGFQPPFTPLGMPSKVTSFTNVLLQPFVGHPSSFHTPEIGTAVAGNADSLPFIHQSGGIRYGTHLYHPPTSATTVLAGNKQHHSAAVSAHPAPRVLSTTGEGKVSASSAKATVGAGAAVAGSPTLVKYP